MVLKEKMSKKQHILMVSICSILLLVGLSFSGNYFLQLSQNNFNWSLVNQFIFSWHTEKFVLASLVLAMILIFCQSLLGSIWLGGVVYSGLIGVVGVVNYLKNFYRNEPLYPDDFKMMAEFGLLKEMVGLPMVIGVIGLVIGVVGLACWQLFRSRRLSKSIQLVRFALVTMSLLSLVYVGGFNKETNVLRKAYNKTALWIPYSQPMNYYNTGFVGGFLYNLSVEPMKEPAGYSEKAIKKILDSYPGISGSEEEKPNIIYVMSESFSDPSRLAGIQVPNNPLEPYRRLAESTYSGQMLSQNYGGGTANIEFEALTSLSMEPFNSQLTTPYTMLVNKLPKAPSIVSFLKDQGYQTTAIHPYNTTMYKRHSVYERFGFDRFLSEKTMTHREKIQANNYISDKAAFEEVMDQLATTKEQQFIHLVTMQTHMPYGDKYTIPTDLVENVANPHAISSYLTDVGYTSEALKGFLADLKSLERRSVVVFWGDHLPSIYGDDIKNKNTDEAMHLTEFALFDSKGQFKPSTNKQIVSPVYFSPKLMEMTAMPQSGFYQLLNQMSRLLPAFEKNMYYQNHQWQRTLTLTPELESLYHDYLLIQYDVVGGKQYSVRDGFYEGVGN